MKRYAPFLIPAVAFLLLKLSSLGVRFSDTNIYFYTAYAVLQGKFLYRDIFFTNFPLFIYVSSFYHLISGGNILFYYFTATLESIGTGFLIYLITFKQTKRRDIATTASAMYLFSYLVLATSDHQSGVFLGSFFATFSYFFYEKKKYFLTGVLLACALLTKAYFLPILIAYLFCLPFKPITKQNPMIQFLAGLSVTSFVVLLPTLLFSFQSFYQDIVTYSLIRPQGISKIAIFNAFVVREFFLFGISLVSIYFIKKYRFFGVLSISMIFFFIFYKDFYFYYFNIAAPFTCIFFATLYLLAEEKFKLQKMVIPTVLGFVIILNLIQYFGTSRNQTISDFAKIVQGVKTLHPPVLYGVNDITPLLAYETGTPLLNNIIDTNPTIFRKGLLNSTTLTKDALSQHALFVGHGVEYPEINAKQDFIDEIFDQSLMESCTMIGNLPVVTEGYINRLQFVTCK